MADQDVDGKSVLAGVAREAIASAARFGLALVLWTAIIGVALYRGDYASITFLWADLFLIWKVLAGVWFVGLLLAMLDSYRKQAVNSQGEPPGGPQIAPQGNAGQGERQ